MIPRPARAFHVSFTSVLRQVKSADAMKSAGVQGYPVVRNGRGRSGRLRLRRKTAPTVRPKKSHCPNTT